MADRPKLGMYWAASCGGCEIALANLHERILEVDQAFEFFFCPCLLDTKKAEVEALPDGGLTITFFNGAIRTEDNRRICGVCPEAHHMASVKALDALFAVEPPPAAKKIRELLYMAFYVTDHTTHFYVLGGPDFILGPEAPPESRNILGVIRKVGLEAGKQVIDCRSRNHGVIKRARPGRPARAVRGTVPEPGVRALHAGAGAGRGVARGIG